MSGKLVFAIAACLLSTVAFAQNSDEADDASSTAKAPAATTTSAQGVEGNAGGESTSTLNTDALKKSKFGLGLLSYTSVKKGSINDGEADAGGLNRVSLSYHLTETKILGAREDFGMTWAKTGRANEGHVTDPFVSYTDTKIGVLPGAWAVTASYRQYLPLGEQTRFVTKANGSEYLALIADKSIGKFDLEGVMIGQYFNNTKDFTQNSKGEYAGTTDYLLEPLAELVYNISPKLAIIHDSAIIATGMRSTPDASVATRASIWYNETYVSIQPNKMIKVMASIEDDATIQGNNAVSLYKDAEMFYNLYLQLTL
jgi:hypothetical protein